MRLTLLILFTLSASGWADESPADRERRVRVALAISATCGVCAADEAGCRREAGKANKPLVLFVGASCGRCGAAAVKAGAVACVVDRYDGDPSPRAVVLEPKPEGGFWLSGTVIGPTPAKVTEAVRKAMPATKVGARLDWDLK